MSDTSTFLFRIFDTAMFGGSNTVALRDTLTALISGGGTPTSAAEHYFRDIRETLIHLVVDAPASVVNGEPHGSNPPRNAREFLSRFDAGTLAALWGGTSNSLHNSEAWTGVAGANKAIVSTLTGKQPVLDSARAEFINLFRTYGAVFNSPPLAVSSCTTEKEI